ncbi:ribose 5-phosphate isomerase B [Atopobacter phocae]|uniref:ribose 5-phosphate isomerase B n=1 Tax=Atopobacter phocae TaxID=136492 RepID=UPI0004728DF7|nr:ribose 5-phosphate isomerase B [Atopobacter phocae]
MKIGIASDHGGFDLKPTIVEYVQSLGHEVTDFGPATGESVDYPEYGEKVADAIVNQQMDLGILICGTGVGMSLAANKVRGIRAVVCSEPFSAKLSRQHNNTNVLCLGARVVGNELAKMIVEEWLAAEFEGGRHARRVDKVMAIESKYADQIEDQPFCG